jgi:O-antigen/teichoic acid export membrane protein
MTGKEKPVLVGTIFSLLINLFLTVQLVPNYGISGAAVATACAIITQNCIFLWLIKNNNILEVET